MSQKRISRVAESKDSLQQLTIVCLLLLVSGGCALSFQIVWTRELRLIFGATTSASAAVLAIFMAGLGLGNSYFGRRLENVQNGLRTYGLMELGIGLLASLTPFLIDFISAIYIRLGGATELGNLATPVRIALSAIVLIPPTFLMGGTLPVAAKIVASTYDTKRGRVAWVYGINALGAVAGAFVANFLLLEILGNRLFLWSMALLNVALATVSLWQSNGRIFIQQAHAVRQEVESSPSAAHLSTLYACVLSAVAGFVFFQMEIVWYRLLSPILGGTTYTFGLILCLVLAGVGVGGMLFAALSKWIVVSTMLVAITFALEAIALGIPYWLGDDIALWTLTESMNPAPNFTAQVWRWTRIGTVVILPASIVAGFQFPTLLALVGSGRERVAEQVGWVCSANTGGAIAGSLVGGFVLLPLFTAVGLWRFAVLLLVVVSLVNVILASSRIRLLMLIPNLIAFVLVVGAGPTAVWRHSGIGANRADIAQESQNELQNYVNATLRTCIWEREGIESSVAITATDGLAFIVNGKSDGNAFMDAGTQIGLGILGPLHHPQAKSALVIGLGTGETAGWMAAASNIEKIDVVELEPSVLEMADLCSDLNRDVMNDGKVSVHINDAREFLLTKKSTYDIVVSEPSNPYRAGVANLFTREFYRSASQKINPDGIFLQWLQGYEVDAPTVKTVLNTLQSVFPSVEVWRTRSSDLVLACRKLPTKNHLEPNFIASRLRTEPGLAEGFSKAWGVTDAPGILAHFVCGTESTNNWRTDCEKINTDDRNLLEYAFARTVGVRDLFSLEELASINASPEGLLRHQKSDWENLIQRRRIAMEFRFGTRIEGAKLYNVTQQRLAKAFQYYRNKDFTACLAEFGELGVDQSCPIELLVYLHAAAESGQALPEELLEGLRSSHKVDSMIVEWIAIAKAEHEHVNSLYSGFVTVVQHLQQDPWADGITLDAFLGHIIDLSEKDSRFAELVFSYLEHRFSQFRKEDSRILTRYIVAEFIGDNAIEESLASIEPHVPWRGWLLERRAAAYSKLKSPLSLRAQIDLDNFHSWSR